MNTAEHLIQDSVQQCLNLIIWDSVDEVLWALNDTYSWFIQKCFTGESYQSNNVLQRFLDHISQDLIKGDIPRRNITAKEAGATFHSRKAIINIIQSFLMILSPEQGIDFLGKLTAAYALEVPEPLFRAASSFAGLHRTADIPAIEDHLPMTDEMILFGWQYFWFYTWLGY